VFGVSVRNPYTNSSVQLNSESMMSKIKKVIILLGLLNSVCEYTDQCQSQLQSKKVMHEGKIKLACYFTQIPQGTAPSTS
jgi:hypothetical protein